MRARIEARDKAAAALAKPMAAVQKAREHEVAKAAAARGAAEAVSDATRERAGQFADALAKGRDNRSASPTRPAARSRGRRRRRACGAGRARRTQQESRRGPRSLSPRPKPKSRAVQDVEAAVAATVLAEARGRRERGDHDRAVLFGRLRNLDMFRQPDLNSAVHAYLNAPARPCDTAAAVPVKAWRERLYRDADAPLLEAN